MIHVICDLCGEEANGNAMFIAITPIADWGRVEIITDFLGHKGKTKAYTVCQNCNAELPFPNHYKERKIEKVNYSYAKRTS